jgi:hypothetical protein
MPSIEFVDRIAFVLKKDLTVKSRPPVSLIFRVEQLKSFPAQVLGDAGQSCVVSTWPHKSVDEPGTESKWHWSL